MNKKKCPICGTEMKIDTSAVCASIPPKFRCECPSCNCVDFIKTSEYDKYKEEPLTSSNLDEAAEEWCKANNKGIALSADKKSHYLVEGVDAFKAGAEWMARHGKVKKYLNRK